MPFLFFSILAGKLGQHDIRVVGIPDYWRCRHCSPSTRSVFRDYDGPPIELYPTPRGCFFRNRYRFVLWSDIEPVDGDF